MSEAAPSKRKFRNTPNIVVPRAGRRVHTPLSNCGLRAISDLMSTAAITGTYPVVNNPTISPPDAGTLYKDLIPGNQSDNLSFDNYRLCLLKDEGYREGGWFTRAFFAPDVTNVFPSALAVPVKTEWKYKDIMWHAIIEDIEFIPDSTTMVPIVHNRTGTIKYVPRMRVKYAYRPSFECSTKIREQYYVSNSPFDLTKFSLPGIPQPHDVSWDLDPIGSSGSIARCLHKMRIEVPAVAKNKGLIQGTASQIFPATNATAWTDYDFEVEVLEDEPFQILIVRRAYAPTMTPITQITEY